MSRAVYVEIFLAGLLGAWSATGAAQGPQSGVAPRTAPVVPNAPPIPGISPPVPGTPAAAGAAPAKRGASLAQTSWTYEAPTEPKQFRLNDQVTVMVSEKSVVESDGQVNRLKQADGKMTLTDWILFRHFSAIKDPQSTGDPAIGGTMKNKYLAQSDVQTRDSMTFKIACQIVDIRPNGTLVLEGRKSVYNNSDSWEQCVTGVVRAEDVLPNNTVLSENVAELRIVKREAGHVRDGYRRGWFLQFLDHYQPFWSENFDKDERMLTKKDAVPMSRRAWVLTLAVAWLLAAGSEAGAKTLVKNICRVKGQQEMSLQGLGIVVGLKGTGDGGGFLPTIRSLARMMELMGRPLGKDAAKELKDAKNIALVSVTATVPAAGVRQGDKLDCVVSAIAAKSLAGGRLFCTPLMARPDPREPRVLALAEGAISLEDPSTITTGRIHAGCRLEEDFQHLFWENDRITLVLDSNHADFEVAQELADQINSQLGLQSSDAPLARALDQVSIEVFIPPQYRDDPVKFVYQVLGLPILEPRTVARVVINERSGSIVISGDVEIGAVVVTHKNVVVEAAGTTTGGRFKPIDVGETPSPRLKALIEALNALQVPSEDVIDIIKGLERNGKLHAQLVIE